jgi:hypothetical protein
MATILRNQLRTKVLDYLSSQPTPVRMSNMRDVLRAQNPSFDQLRDSDFRDLVQAMIVTGKLSYAPGLKIQLGPTPR